MIKTYSNIHSNEIGVSINIAVGGFGDEVDGVLTLKDRCTHTEEQGGLLTKFSKMINLLEK